MIESIAIWSAAGLAALLIFIQNFKRFRRQRKEDLNRQEEAQSLGISRPRGQYPFINTARCLGCGSCVAACPEGDVLGVVYGHATIINAMRCVGHGYCEEACPISAIQVGLGDVSAREDIPLLDEHCRTNVPNLFIAGELSGITLIRNAINQAKTAIDKIAADPHRSQHPQLKDVLIVGAGPAGFSAALSAVQHKLSYLVLDQQDPGGAILQFPRRKLVLTQPVKLPLYGWLKKPEYTREELLDIWNAVIERFRLEILTGHQLTGIEKPNGAFRVLTSQNAFYARNVLLALGRRGTPNKLNISGEDLPKVTYQLVDARSYTNRRILIVGGGDSAVEAAIALASQDGNQVVISYRREQFFRIKQQNRLRLEVLVEERKIHPLLNSRVAEIRESSVQLETPQGALDIPNDYVFILIGGVPPFKLLKEIGIAFGGESCSEEIPAGQRERAPVDVLR